MKRFPGMAFTLLEMIVVIAIILILVGIAIPICSYALGKSARLRAAGEIAGMSAALASYQADFGSLPRDPATDALDPRMDFDPIGVPGASRYRSASLVLYSALSGDDLPAGMPDGRPERKAYFAFNPNQLKMVAVAGGAQAVGCVQDPFGNCYGYSTAGNSAETQYQAAVQSDPAVARPTARQGYNPTFDLWSTAGQTTSAGANKWVKNWPDP